MARDSLYPNFASFLDFRTFSKVQKVIRPRLTMPLPLIVILPSSTLISETLSMSMMEVFPPAGAIWERAMSEQSKVGSNFMSSG